MQTRGIKSRSYDSQDEDSYDSGEGSSGSESQDSLSVRRRTTSHIEDALVDHNFDLNHAFGRDKGLDAEKTLTLASIWLAIILGIPMFAQAVWMTHCQATLECSDYTTDCMKKRLHEMLEPKVLSWAVALGVLWQIGTLGVHCWAGGDTYDDSCRSIFTRVAKKLLKRRGYRVEGKLRCLHTVGLCMAVMLTCVSAAVCWIPALTFGEVVHQHFVQCLPKEPPAEPSLKKFVRCQVNHTMGDMAAPKLPYETMLNQDLVLRNWGTLAVATTMRLSQTSLIEVFGSVMGCGLLLVRIAVCLQSIQSKKLQRRRVKKFKEHRKEVMEQLAHKMQVGVQWPLRGDGQSKDDESVESEELDYHPVTSWEAFYGKCVVGSDPEARQSLGTYTALGVGIVHFFLPALVRISPLDGRSTDAFGPGSLLCRAQLMSNLVFALAIVAFLKQAISSLSKYHRSLVRLKAFRATWDYAAACEFAAQHIHGCPEAHADFMQLYFCVDMTNASGLHHLLAWRMTRKMIVMEMAEDKADAEGVILVGLFGFFCCLLLSTAIYFFGTGLSYTLKFILMLDTLVFGVPVILSLKTYVRIIAFLKEDLVLLTNIRETTLYPANNGFDRRDSFARTVRSPFLSRPSFAVDPIIYELTDDVERATKTMGMGTYVVKSTQELRLLRHAACLEALVVALDKDTSSEELLGAKVDARAIQKLFVLTATSLLSIFGQIMRKLVLSDES